MSPVSSDVHPPEGDTEECQSLRNLVWELHPTSGIQNGTGLTFEVAFESLSLDCPSRPTSHATPGSKPVRGAAGAFCYSSSLCRIRPFGPGIPDASCHGEKTWAGLGSRPAPAIAHCEPSLPAARWGCDNDELQPHFAEIRSQFSSGQQEVRLQSERGRSAALPGQRPQLLLWNGTSCPASGPGSPHPRHTEGYQPQLSQTTCVQDSCSESGLPGPPSVLPKEAKMAWMLTA